MSCPSEFRIFKGRKVSKLPSSCDVCFVLLSHNCTLYQKVSTCKHKDCTSCGKFTWKQIHLKEPFVFLDVCKEIVTLVNIKTNPCQLKSSCSSSCGSCSTCSSGTSISGTVTTTTSTTSELGATPSTCPLDTDPTIVTCTVSVDNDNTLRAISTLSTCENIPDGNAPTVLINNLAEWSVCGNGNPDLAGSILGSASRLLLVTSPGSNATVASLSDDPNQLTVQNVFDPGNTQGIQTLVFNTENGAFRAGVFSAEALGDILLLTLDVNGEVIPRPTTAIGTNTQATGINSFAQGWNSFAYLPGSMAHSSCFSEAVTRQQPPVQPLPATVGSCQYIRFLMTGQTTCVSGADLCDAANGSSCISSSAEACGSQNCTITQLQFDCNENTPTCKIVQGVPDCVPGGDASTFCPPSGDENYAVTTFYTCDPTVDLTAEPILGWIYLPYTGTAFGEIEIVAPRVVGCNAAPLFCPFAQKWCFIVSQIQGDTETTHIIDKIEPMCGNNSLSGHPGDERYTLCGIVSGCPDNGYVRFTFQLIRNDPIGTYPGDSVAPNFCATVKMTMVASGICTPIDCGFEVVPRECFLCCPITVDARGCEECFPRCNDCTARVECGPSCRTPSSRAGSTSSSSSASIASNTRFASPKTVNRGVQSGPTSARSIKSGATSVQSARSVQSGTRSARSVQSTPPRTGAKKGCSSCGGAKPRSGQNPTLRPQNRGRGSTRPQTEKGTPAPSPHASTTETVVDMSS